MSALGGTWTCTGTASKGVNIKRGKLMPEVRAGSNITLMKGAWLSGYVKGATEVDPMVISSGRTDNDSMIRYSETDEHATTSESEGFQKRSPSPGSCRFVP